MVWVFGAIQLSYIDELKKWLDDRAPLSENKVPKFMNSKLRAKFFNQKTNIIKEKARVSVKWRESLAARLGLNDDEIVRATNTIIELIEQELVSGRTVRIANFGDFVLVNRSKGEKKATKFIPAKTWLQEINEPLSLEDIGLLRTYRKGRLTRRNIGTLQTI